MVETPRFHCRGHDWIPYLELRSHMPHSRAKKKGNGFWILFPSKCFPTSLTCHPSLVDPGWLIYLFLFLTLKVRFFFDGYIFHCYLPERYSFTGECIGMSSWKQFGNVCKNTDSFYPLIQSLRNYSVGINIQRELFLIELFFSMIVNAEAVWKPIGDPLSGTVFCTHPLPTYIKTFNDLC